MSFTNVACAAHAQLAPPASVRSLNLLLYTLPPTPGPSAPQSHGGIACRSQQGNSACCY